MGGCIFLRLVTEGAHWDLKVKGEVCFVMYPYGYLVKQRF